MDITQNEFDIIRARASAEDAKNLITILARDGEIVIVDNPAPAHSVSPSDDEGLQELDSDGDGWLEGDQVPGVPTKVDEALALEANISRGSLSPAAGFSEAAIHRGESGARAEISVGDARPNTDEGVRFENPIARDESELEPVVDKEAAAAAMKSDLEAARESLNSEPEKSDEESISASPQAAKLAEEEGVSLSKVEGSGADGRVLKSDVESALEEK